MINTRLKLGLTVAVLFGIGSALFWNGLFRGATNDLRQREDSDRIMVVVNGGRPEARPEPKTIVPRREERTPRRVAPVRPPSVRPEPVRDFTVYEVRPGDSLCDIAVDTCGDFALWTEIAKLNGIPDPYVIVPGQKLRLPPRGR